MNSICVNMFENLCLITYIPMLEIREWSCAECGTVHGRDINAAKSILRLGDQTLAVEIPAL